MQSFEELRFVAAVGKLLDNTQCKFCLNWYSSSSTSQHHLLVIDVCARYITYNVIVTHFVNGMTENVIMQESLLAQCGWLYCFRHLLCAAIAAEAAFISVAQASTVSPNAVCLVCSTQTRASSELISRIRCDAQ